MWGPGRDDLGWGTKKLLRPGEGAKAKARSQGLRRGPRKDTFLSV